MYQNIATKVLTGEVRLSYCHLNEPYANASTPGAKKRFGATLLIPKSDTATKADIDAAMRAAYEDGVANKWKGMRPQLSSPLIWDGDGKRKGGDSFGPECKGHWVITANTPNDQRKPQVVDVSNINVELDPRDVYSGMYARVTLNFFSFSQGGNKGVGCGLGNVMKTRDGEPLSGGSSAASDFDGIGQAVAPAAGFAPQGVATPEYGAAMPATPGQASPVTGTPRMGGVQINPITGQPMHAAGYGVNPITGQPVTGTPRMGGVQINPITGQPM